ncbi:MAG: hypothetical protein R2862_11965 [Thermoanaerobaculia bacterium]
MALPALLLHAASLVALPRLLVGIVLAIALLAIPPLVALRFSLAADDRRRRHGDRIRPFGRRCGRSRVQDRPASRPGDHPAGRRVASRFVPAPASR